MEVAGIVIGALIGLLGLMMGGQYLASEAGEVVVIESRDAEGQARHTRIWVVDDAGVQWIRGKPESGWVQRVLADFEIRVERGGVEKSYRAVPDRDPQARQRVNALMRDKYGIADRYVAVTLGDSDRSSVLPFRLEPY